MSIRPAALSGSGCGTSLRDFGSRACAASASHGGCCGTPSSVPRGAWRAGRANRAARRRVLPPERLGRRIARDVPLRPGVRSRLANSVFRRRRSARAGERWRWWLLPRASSARLRHRAGLRFRLDRRGSPRRRRRRIPVVRRARGRRGGTRRSRAGSWGRRGGRPALASGRRIGASAARQRARAPTGRADRLRAVHPRRSGRRRNPRADRTHHVITNLLIDLDGDRAKVRANLIATFVHRADAPGAHFDIGERYQFEAVRTPQGWLLSRVHVSPVWTSGSRDGADAGRPDR